jgi:hypothetical protein
MYQGYVSIMYQYHQDMNLNHVQKRSARNFLSMCHTIHDKILKQTHKKHTFTYEVELIHIISDSVTTLVYHHTLLQPEPSILLQIWLNLAGHMPVITWGLT